MSFLNVNAFSGLPSVTPELKNLVIGFESSFSKGEISEAQKAMASREVLGFRRNLLTNQNFSIDAKKIAELKTSIQEKMDALNRSETQFFKDSFSKDFDGVLRLAKDIDTLVAKEISLQASVNDSEVISINFSDKKVVKEIFSKKASELLAVFQKAELYLHLLFCERTVVSGVEVFNRRISRSQKEELKKFIDEKKQECETFLAKKRIETSKHLEDLVLKALGYIEMEEISTSKK